jgi:hypothetical protein
MFPCENEKTKVAEEYCWVITQLTRRILLGDNTAHKWVGNHAAADQIPVH